MTLYGAHRGNQCSWSCGIANAPASHCKTLRDAIDGEGTVHKVGGYLGWSAELEIIIDQMLIDIIAEYPDMGMALQHFGQGAQFVPVIAGACGVAGRIKNKPFRAWSDCRLERFGR